MTDLARLNEAIDWLDHQPYAEAYTAAKELRAYADLLANGERVEWCETHNAESIQNHRGMSDECWRVVWVDNGEPEGVDYPYNLCSIVSRLLVDPPKEEK